MNLHPLNHSKICSVFSLELNTHMKHLLHTLWRSYWSDSLKCCWWWSHGESVCVTACSRITVNTGLFYSSSGFHWSVWMFLTSSETDTVHVYTSQPVNGFMWSHETLKGEFEKRWVHRAHVHMPTAHISITSCSSSPHSVIIHYIYIHPVKSCPNYFHVLYFYISMFCCCRYNFMLTLSECDDLRFFPDYF